MATIEAEAASLAETTNSDLGARSQQSSSTFYTAPSQQSSSPRFQPPAYTSFPPFYTLQPNLTTRAAQLELWSSLITSYCAFHRLFRLSLSALPSNLFSNPSINRALKQNDIRTVLDHLSKPENGPRIEWIPASTRGEQSNTCYVYWKTAGEWADAIYAWIDATGQKGTVLTLYEIRESDAVRGMDWVDMDESLLRKILGVLVKRGKAQIFGQEDGAGIKFF